MSILLLILGQRWKSQKCHHHWKYNHSSDFHMSYATYIWHIIKVCYVQKMVSNDCIKVLYEIQSFVIRKCLLNTIKSDPNNILLAFFMVALACQEIYVSFTYCLMFYETLGCREYIWKPCLSFIPCNCIAKCKNLN